MEAKVTTMNFANKAAKVEIPTSVASEGVKTFQPASILSGPSLTVATDMINDYFETLGTIAKNMAPSEKDKEIKADREKETLKKEQEKELLEEELQEEQLEEAQQSKRQLEAEFSQDVGIRA